MHYSLNSVVFFDMWAMQMLLPPPPRSLSLSLSTTTRADRSWNSDGRKIVMPRENRNNRICVRYMYEIIALRCYLRRRCSQVVDKLAHFCEPNSHDVRHSIFGGEGRSLCHTNAARNNEAMCIPQLLVRLATVGRIPMSNGLKHSYTRVPFHGQRTGTFIIYTYVHILIDLLFGPTAKTCRRNHPSVYKERV